MHKCLLVISAIALCSTVNAQTSGLHHSPDSVAFLFARALQVQLKCSDDQFQHIYEIEKVKFRKIDSILQMQTDSKQKQGGILVVNQSGLYELRKILTDAQWHQFQLAETERQRKALERLRSRGVIVDGVANQEYQLR